MRFIASLIVSVRCHMSYHYMGYDIRSPQYAAYYAQYCAWFQATYGYQYQPQCSQYIRAQPPIHHETIRPYIQAQRIESSDSASTSHVSALTRPGDDDDEEPDDMQEEPLDVPNVLPSHTATSTTATTPCYS